MNIYDFGERERFICLLDFIIYTNIYNYLIILQFFLGSKEFLKCPTVKLVDSKYVI